MGMAMQQPNPASNTNLLALPEGTELVGDYRIQRVLGAGGFGITYLANEPALARLVTIKEYFPADYAARGATSQASPRSQGCAEDYKWGLERFIEEARTLARFIHPNIVRVHRHFLANNTGYMVLEFEEGGSFKAWLKGLKRAPRQPELDRIVAPLLDALELVHKGDYLHRDIAPDNIIIRKDGSPVLIDFGSARGEIASHSKTVSALVKPGYSPYEQYATTSSKQGPWTDIYALGATLYHALSGKRPPDAPSRMVNDEYVSARDAALSSYRPTFLAAIDKALRLEVGERPQSIADWRKTLLAPEPKRDGRLSLARALQRLRTGDFKPKPKPEPEPPPSAEPPSDTPSLVPAPPDAPQPKGQLLDFIEGLKKHRPAFAAKKALPAARAAPAPASSPAPVRQPSGAQFGLGYGPPREHAASVASAGQAVAAISQSVERPVPAVLVRRAPPRPRRVRGWRVPSRRWRSLLYKLLIGLGIAGLAVAYQDRLPRVEGRGANVVSSQTADLAPAARINGPQRLGDRHGRRRPGALDRVGRHRRHAQGVERGIGRAGAHHRARRRPSRRSRRRSAARAHRPQGRRRRAVGPGARREARGLPTPGSSHFGTGLHQRSESIRGRRPSRSCGALRHPHARGAGGPARRPRRCRAGDRKHPVRAHRCGRPRSGHQAMAHRHAQPRAHLARAGRDAERARHRSRRPHGRQRQCRRLGAPLVGLLLAHAALVQGA